MKFMKLGSRPDQFRTDGDNIRYVATELERDIVINVQDVKFYLHKFPLLSRSSRLQKLVACTNEESGDEINIYDIPGGPVAFEICAKFCYCMTITLNAYNVVSARCAAEYLEMYETVEKGNLIHKIDVFLTSSIFQSWKDSIIVLQTTKSFLPWSEDLKIISLCLDCIASKASVHTSKVEWSYTYNRTKHQTENGSDSHWNGVKKQLMVPNDWWIEDLCELPVDLYKRTITTIKSKGRMPANIIGDALETYTLRRLPGFGEVVMQGDDLVKYSCLVDTIIKLLPSEKNSASCSFLLKLLQASMKMECGETAKKGLMRKIGQQLEEATVADLMFQGQDGVTLMYGVDIVRGLVEQFKMQEQCAEVDFHVDYKFQDNCHLFISDSSKAKVAKLVDKYLAEAARDVDLPSSKFVDLAETTSYFPRPSHDEIYRAIDMYLKEHPGITKTERKRICKLMDCRKLSADACMHVVQNDRLPLRVVVQVLFFEQIRGTTSSGGNSTPEIPGSIGSLHRGGSSQSSRSGTTSTEDDWDAVLKTDELKALKGEIASLRSRDGVDATSSKVHSESVALNKAKGPILSRLLSKLWSDRHSESSS